MPALNRVQNNTQLLGPVQGVYPGQIRKVFEELGFVVRPYKGKAPLRVPVAKWAARYPAHVVVLHTQKHILVAYQGRVYDNHAPHGPLGCNHPYAKDRVLQAELIQESR